MKHLTNRYDIIVIGAGHAGCEAALAGARMGCKTLLITINMEKIALMPCNPAVGGIGKGHLVKEIDALGGEIGFNTDKATIQAKILNRKKGPAVQALRAQADKKQYETYMKHTLESQEKLELVQGIVSKILTDDGRFSGVITVDDQVYKGKTGIVATGTFLRGAVIIGDIKYPAGRMGEYPALHLSDSLRQLGLNLGRFQSATPPRIHRRSIDISLMQEQPGDPDNPHFSIRTKPGRPVQLPCYLTYTDQKTHQVVSENLHLSPIKTGVVDGHGPRNCPSIDRKVMNFPEKTSHPVFIEPEGRQTEEMYLQGLTTAMPVHVQEKIIRATPGLENAELIRPGYAIEYDYIVPDQLNISLETKTTEGLFTAGQINGTSGYEEAAAQGLMAGINAALKARGEPPFILDRSQAYIGVLIDDLVTKGVDEPYRMYTSRAEHRLLLRADNADLRLANLGKELGLLSQKANKKIIQKKKSIKEVIKIINTEKVKPDNNINKWLAINNSQPLTRVTFLASLLKRPEISITKILEINTSLTRFSEDILKTVETEIKYEGYIARQTEKAKQQHKLEEKQIPDNIDYHQLKGISFQAREKLSKVKPRSLGQAARVSSVSPADISVLSVCIEQIKRRDSTDKR